MLILGVCGVLASCGSAASNSEDTIKTLSTAEDREALAHLNGEQYVGFSESQQVSDGEGRKVLPRLNQSSLIRLQSEDVGVITIDGVNYEVTNGTYTTIGNKQFLSQVYVIPQTEIIDGHIVYSGNIVLIELWNTAQISQTKYAFSSYQQFTSPHVSSFFKVNTTVELRSNSFKLGAVLSGHLMHTRDDFSSTFVFSNGTLSYLGDQSSGSLGSLSLSLPFELSITMESAIKTYRGVFVLSSLDNENASMTAFLYSSDGKTKVGRLDVAGEDQSFKVYLYNESGELELLSIDQ